MLVVTRKPGEQIQIGHDITVTVVRVAQGTVRIGIEAPRDVGIARDEIVVTGDDPDHQPEKPLPAPS